MCYYGCRFQPRCDETHVRRKEQPIRVSPDSEESHCPRGVQRTCLEKFWTSWDPETTSCTTVSGIYVDGLIYVKSHETGPEHHGVAFRPPLLPQFYLDRLKLSILSILFRFVGMEFQNTPDYHGWTEINLNAALIGLTTFFFFTRMYVRAIMTKTLGWDDAIATLAYLMLIVQSSLDIRGEYPAALLPCNGD